MAYPYPSAPFYGAYPGAQYYPQQPQYHPQQPIRNLPNFPHPNTQLGPIPPPYHNPPRFDGNHQIPSPGAFPPFPPASFNPELIRQYSASNPPPFPPLSSFPPYNMPNGNFSHNQQPPPAFNHFPLQRPAQPIGVAAETGINPRIEEQENSESPKKPESIGTPPDETQVRSSEDGEISDGEIDGSVAMSVHQSPRQTSQDRSASTQDSSKASDPNLLGNDQSAGDSMQQSEESEGEESASSYNPPSASLPEDQADTNGTITQAVSQNGKVAAPSFNSASDQMREHARDALRALVPYNITYTHLVREGVDARVLQELYAELGISDPKALPTSANNTNTPSEIAGNDSMDQILSKLGGTPKPVINGYKPITAPQVSSKDSPSQSSSAPMLPGLTVPTKANLPFLSPVQSTPSPLLERKDRIAQLLAAKAGKFPATRITTETPSLVVSQQSVPPSQPTAQAPSEPAQLSLPGPTASVEPPPPENAQISLESKAESHLAQQKAAIPSMNMRTKASGESVLPLNERDRSHDSYAPRAQFASVIPGLFMTSAEVREIERAALESGLNRNQGPHASFGETTNQAVETDDDELQYQNTSNKTSVAMSHDSSELNENSKRSLTLELSEDPLRPPKRLFDPNKFSNETQLETETDTVDLDGASEGEIMEMDSAPQSALSDKHLPQSATAADISGSSKALPLLSTQSQALDSNTKQDVSRVSTIGTTSANGQSQGNLWQVKNQEIEAMRKRIAEMEERRKLKRSQSQTYSPSPSGLSTPTMTKSTQPQTIPSPPRDTPAVSLDPNSTPFKPNYESKATTASPAADPAGQAAFAAKAAALKAEIVRQRLLRQKTLQEGLPDLKLEVQKTEARLAERKAAMVRMELEKAKRLAELEAAQKDLADEIQRLEADLRQGNSGEKGYSEELQTLRTQPDTTSQDTHLDTAMALQSSSPVVIADQLSGSSAPPRQPEALAGAEFSVSQRAFPVEGDPGLSQSRDKQMNAQEKTLELVEVASPNASDKSESRISYTDARSEPEAETEGRSPGITQELVEILSSPSQQGNQEGVEGSLMAHSPAMSGSMMDLDDDSDGSASMSDSRSDDYEPIEPTKVRQTNIVSPEDEESDEYEPEEAPNPISTDPVQDFDDAMDDYEPAEIITPNDTDALSLPRPLLPNGLVSASGIDTGVDVREEGLQLAESSTLTKPQGPSKSVDDVASIMSDVNPTRHPFHYVPYKSPLSSLKSFRFNPNYNQIVKDGYRSLTFSYNINPNEPLCATELAGETCTDPTCEEQHFRQMGLADAKILEQLASANDIDDKAQRDDFLVGLKSVIAGLRSRGVKEFSEVANELAAYRRRFREQQDPALLPPSD